MSLHFYQIAVVLISLVMVYFGIEKFISRQATQSPLKLLVRLTIWGGMSAVAIFPEASDVLAKFIGIEDNINAVVLMGFLLIFLLVFKILSVIERIEQDISILTRKETLKQLDKPFDNK